jgi:HK97 gp10 family phage protein
MGKVTIEGLKEVDEALKDLPKAVGKNILRRVLRKIAQPMADDMKAAAPVDEGALRNSIGVGTKLTKRQSSLHRRMFRDDRASVEMFVGAGGLPQAHLREFGGDNAPAHPFARPAWDGNKDKALATIKNDLWAEIEKAAARAARKAARLAARG